MCSLCSKLRQDQRRADEGVRRGMQAMRRGLRHVLQKEVKKKIEQSACIFGWQ
jgi:hypothetical protein